jgi:hypothetical protein
VFRLDRLSAMTVLDDRFREEPGKTVCDFLRQDAARARLRLAAE